MEFPQGRSAGRTAGKLAEVYEVAPHPHFVNCHVGPNNIPMRSGPSYEETMPHGYENQPDRAASVRSRSQVRSVKRSSKDKRKNQRVATLSAEARNDLGAAAGISRVVQQIIHLYLQSAERSEAQRRSNDLGSGKPFRSRPGHALGLNQDLQSRDPPHSLQDPWISDEAAVDTACPAE